MLRIPLRLSIVGTAVAVALTGCYVVPVNPDGTPLRTGAIAMQPLPVYAPVVPFAPVPSVLQARLYPSNAAATRTGVLAGTVTNMMNGKGRFQLDYAGELLSGESTRVPGDDHAGLANAYGARGTFMNCQYRMTTPSQGTGTCELSTGAQYQVHIGV